ncbi:MAG TPA: DUF1365 domain-containing protein [Phycisphaerae bacterium]|nr:DUF1365 domain-containing protein [Phycisphaerae bacterium]HRW54245.1 DUF1365 domain-containing protein [Phycisphaerae bacterium]
MESRIYEGEVRHRRSRPVEHAFCYRVCMLYLDLAELDHVFEGTRLWSVEGRGVASFRRRDHLGAADRPLDECVRELVAERTGRRLTGPIRLLTHPAYWGYRFNPVSFYYCFDEAGALRTIVAEVNNTPWNEQHCYVLDALDRADESEAFRFRFAKRFHVSPFMGMNHEYDWRFSEPGERLNVAMVNLEAGERLFDASMTMRRRAISPAALRLLLVRFPLMSMRVITAIYWQAARLRLKRAPFFPHPDDEMADFSRNSA